MMETDKNTNGQETQPETLTPEDVAMIREYIARRDKVIEQSPHVFSADNDEMKEEQMRCIKQIWELEDSYNSVILKAMRVITRKKNGLWNVDDTLRTIFYPTRATAKRADKVEYPLDKVNSVVWGLDESASSGRKLHIAAEPRGVDCKVDIWYSINFDALGEGVSVSKQLLPFDKRVYIAVASLFGAGNDVISLTQIHSAMGNTGKPSPAQISKIRDAIKKMNSATITVDNSQEIEAKYKYAQFKYWGSLLPFEMVEASVNGKLTEAAIHIFKEPPLISFAKQRRQIATIPMKLLQSPVNKTDANLQLEDYLLERISRLKQKREPGRILYGTLFKAAGIETKMQRQRAPEKIKTYLKYYQQNDFIKGYTMDKEGITVMF
jgi:hypothetical protein